ncbi:cyclic pyranopterin monophosphate synthase, mitochondrial [Henckelia pumila]|uniref:cyclic pyranopterin monophosphate synthase, mitochondrial n=1 Tax=Henckelia pumila TaxID=405737 RepID=UPI003C6E3AD3
MPRNQAQSVMFPRRVASKLKPLPRCTRLFSSDLSHDLSRAILELNQEMESVFGEPPASSSSYDQVLSQESKFPSNDLTEKEHISGLSHVDSKGIAQMVDVSSKEITKRVAVASCKVILGQRVFDLVSSNQMAKGDVLSVAKIAGVCGAKQTSNLIPLCHNINLTNVCVDLILNPRDLSVEIRGEAASTGRTGVEMEALTAVTVAGLTVYDMCKAASKDILLTDVRLEHKSGGKSGEWTRKN